MRHKHVTGEPVGEDRFKVHNAVVDTFFSGWLSLMVSVPSLEIKSIEGQITRSFNEECQQAIPILQKVVGTHIRPGLTRRVDGMVGGANGCTNMANFIMESCHAAYEGVNQNWWLYAESRGLHPDEMQKLVHRHRSHGTISCIVRRMRRSRSQTEQDLEGAPAWDRSEGELPFTRRTHSKIVGVGRKDKDTFYVRSVLEARIHSFLVEMEVKRPHFEITAVRGEIRRSPSDDCERAIPVLQNALGIRIEPGLTAKMDERVGRAGCPRLSNLLLEGCHGVIQGTASAMLEDYKEAGQTPGYDAFRKRWLESMPIMRNTCLAYCDNSPLIGRLEVKW